MGSWTNDAVAISLVETVLRLLLAVVLGAAIGFEREWKKKPAGLRTHMMVCLGTASFALVALDLFGRSLALSTSRFIDPLRALEATIGGIGFLGAGTIIVSRASVAGITTASGIWVAGGIGLACGWGCYGIAVSTVVLAVFILGVLRSVEARLFPRRDGEGEADGGGETGAGAG